MQEVSVKREINAPIEKVRATLWEIKNWSRFWSPLHKVDISYDDGIHQDFTMFLEWQNLNTYVRTVRFLDDKGDILFFSPSPPFPMSLHQGIWKLSSNQLNTNLEAIRFFELPYQPNELLEDYQKRLEIFSDGFKKRLIDLLKCLDGLCKT